MTRESSSAAADMAASPAMQAAIASHHSTKRFEQMEAQFRAVVGPSSVDDLGRLLTARPILTIGGDQLTGKSTLSKTLSEYFKGTFKSAGTIFRAIAAQRGISVAELSRRAQSEPAIDVQIDYNLCLDISAGNPDHPLIIEGRQPAIMASYMKEAWNKPNCVRLFLSCDVRHQALRFIKREVSEASYEVAKAHLPHKPYKNLAEVAEDIKDLKIDGLENVTKIFLDNAHRDRDDQARYAMLYGFTEDMNYNNLGLYDIVVDTTHRNITEVFDTAVAALTQIGFASDVKPSGDVAAQFHHAHEHHKPAHTESKNA